MGTTVHDNYDRARARIPVSASVEDVGAAFSRLLDRELTPEMTLMGGPVVAFVDADGKNPDGNPCLFLGGTVREASMFVANGGEDVIRAVSAEFGGTFRRSDELDEWEDAPVSGPTP